MATRKLIQPANVVTPKVAYSQGIEVSGSRMLFIAGQLPFDATGALVGVGNASAQVTQVFENLKAMLAAAGASFENVVKLNYYLTDIKLFPAIQEIRVKYLVKPYPAATLVAVAALVHPQALVEIEAVAVM